MPYTSHNKIISEISELYELALAIGNSLDPKRACEDFVEVLKRQKNLEFCAIWTREIIENPYHKNYKLLYAEPRSWVNQKEINGEHELIKKLELHRSILCEKSLSKNDTMCLFSSNRVGKTWSIDLPNIGFLQIYVSKDNPSYEFLNEFGIKKLQKVIAQFAVSLRACLTHEALEIESKKAKELQIQLKMLAVVSQKTENLIIITDKDGNTEWVNNGFEKNTGYTLSDLKGQKPGVILQGPATDPKTVAYFAKKLADKENFRIEILNYDKEGKEYWIDAAVQPVFDENKKLVNYVAIQTNISKRKKIELELKNAKETAEEAVKVKEDFMSIIGHEVKAPVNGIIAMSELLHKMDLNPEQSDYVNAIQISADNLRSVVNSLMDFNELEKGELTLKKIPFNLKQLLENIIARNELKAEEKSIGLFSSIDKNIHEHLLGDPVRLSQVLLSLSNSAMKSTENGEINISAKLITKMANANVIEFSLKCTGVKADSLENYISKNQQENEGEVLSESKVAQKLVRQMGGVLKFTKANDQESSISFIIGFPVSSIPTDKEASQINSLLSKRVLVAEDNSLNQFFIRKLIESWKMEVDTVENGIQATQQANLKHYDIILMDLQMPKLDGISATAEIRKLNAKIPIIALTGINNESELNKLKSKGFNDILGKPFSPDDLKKILIEHTAKISTLKLNNEQSQESTYDNSLLVNMVKGDQAQVRHMERLFVKQAQEVSEEMVKALEIGKHKKVGELAQKIKASIDLMQIKILKEEVRSLESLCKKDESHVDIKDKAFKVIQTLKLVQLQINASHL